jgi:hypothetical protein
MLVDAQKNHNNEAVIERFFHLWSSLDFKNIEEADTASGKTRKSAGFAKKWVESTRVESLLHKNKTAF